MAAQRTAMAARMQRAEPAPTVKEATEAARVARNILRRWTFDLPRQSWPRPWPAVLHRQGALRALDANQRRWGEL